MIKTVAVFDYLYLTNNNNRYTLKKKKKLKKMVMTKSYHLFIVRLYKTTHTHVLNSYLNG